MDQLKAVIFDIDGTLTTDNSWIALTREMGADVNEHEKINADYIANKIVLTDATRKLVELWQATGNANRHFIFTLLKKIPLSPEASAIITQLKESGYKICLITGSFDLYASIVAKELEVSDYFANSRFIWDMKGNLTDFIYQPEQAKQKLYHLQEYCSQYDLELTDCATVGDDYNDIEIFKATAHGIVLKKKRIPELESVAWKKISSLHELAFLL